MSRSHTHTLTLTLKHTNKIVRFFSFVLLLFCALFILCLSFPTHLHTVPVCLSPHPSVSPPVYLQTCLSPNVLTLCRDSVHTHTHTHTHTHRGSNWPKNNCVGRAYKSSVPDRDSTWVCCEGREGGHAVCVTGW